VEAEIQDRRRQGRAPRAVAFVAALCTLVGWASMAAAQEADADRSEVVLGGELFQANCAVCHGTRLEGGTGDGDLDGPALTDADIAYVDMTMRTGRMPIVAEEVGVRTEQLSDDQREAINAYLLATFDLPGRIPAVGEGSAAEGQEPYVRNCAACHGAAGDGGIAGANNEAPHLIGLDGTAIAEAARVGPFTMPAFDTAVLDDDELDDIVAYLEFAGEIEPTIVGVTELDQVGEALFAIGLALLAAVVVWIVARARRWSPAEPESFARTDPFRPR
jgi:ubiquinol-cytochrome c reductase cytochrome c subunit